MKISFFSRKYHDMPVTLAKPDLAIAYNLGLSVWRESWGPTLQRLCDSNTLCCLSSHCKEEAEFDCKTLEVIFGSAVLHGPDLNPFQSKLMRPGTSLRNRAFYSNQYVVVFKGYKPGHIRKPVDYSKFLEMK